MENLSSKQLIEAHIERQVEALDSWVKTGPLIQQRLQAQTERIEALEQHFQKRIEALEVAHRGALLKIDRLQKRIEALERKFEKRGLLSRLVG